MQVKERITNRQRVLDYLLVYGSVTNLESSRWANPILALSQEIDRLEKDGWVIRHEKEKNEGKNWTRYHLVDPEHPERIPGKGDSYEVPVCQGSYRD